MRRYGNSSAAALSGRRQRRPSVSASSSGATRGHRPDYMILIFMSILLIVGGIVVYAIGPGLTSGTDLPENYYSIKQLTSIALGIVGFSIASQVPVDKWKSLTPIIAGAAAFFAVAVRFIGDEINGTHRWIQVGGLSFQTAELVKLALVLWLAGYYSKRIKQSQMPSEDTFKTIGIIAIVITVVVAGLQSDLGSAAVMMAIVGVGAFVSGLPLKKIAIGFTVVACLVGIAISTSSYRRDRVSTFLNPTADCRDEGYQACQALITIGSGGLFGKGLGKSVQAYGYLPEPANDSIFAIVAEKFGFVGSVSVLGIFWLLLRRMKIIASAAPDAYSRLLVTGVLVWLGFQAIINIGAMIGLLPLKGITLPFVSYGGTSIIFVMTAMGIVFHISKYTDLSAVASQGPRRRSNPTRRRRS